MLAYILGEQNVTMLEISIARILNDDPEYAEFRRHIKFKRGALAKHQ